MIIKRLNTESASIGEIAAMMADKTNGLQTLNVTQINWPETFPYKPEVKVRIAHNSNELLLQYEVEEKYTMANVTEDNGEVWTDSCCECFISFDETGYYNLETTCIGKALFAFRQSRENAHHAEPEIMQTIRRHASLGTEPFSETVGANKWNLTVAVPVSAFFGHKIEKLDGVEARLNVYKCGDKLSVPHFVSLYPINFPKPNFHLPEFFQAVRFE